VSVGIISHPDCLLYDMGSDHPESPERLRVIENTLKKSDIRSLLHFYEANAATEEDLKRAHDSAYVDGLFKRAQHNKIYSLDPDTIMMPFTLRAACLAAGAVIQGIDLVMQNKESKIFCNVRPPGHHAERNKAMGFCFFNNIAVGASYALEHYKLKKIAIVDFDVHHGNGTEDIFRDESKVLFCSSFQYPFYPYNIDIKQQGHILHIPLLAGTDGVGFCESVLKYWIPALINFEPELILISAGFDAHIKDPLANINLTEEDYYWVTQEMVKIAKQSCGGRIVSTLEGGYNLSVLGQCVLAHVKAFLELPFKENSVL